jgi:uncharacterized membrane protein YbhN (UPF0104 family)
MPLMLQRKNKYRLQNTSLKIQPKHIIFLLLALLGIYYVLPQLGQFGNTVAAARHASWLYLALGLGLTGLTFLSAALTQYAAGNLEGSFSIIVLIQFAGSFINHFLPFSLGSIGLTSQYYQKISKHRAEAIAIAILPIIFGVISTVSIVALLSPVTISHLAHNYRILAHNKWLVAVAALGLAVGIVALPSFQKRIKNLLKETIHGLRALQSVRQIALLIGGSIAISLTASLTLLVSAKAVHASVAFIDVFVLYVTSSLISNIVPTPGGLGATEAVLAVGLASTGVAVPQAVAATLFYRLITFWLPIPIGIFCLRRVNKSSNRF